MTVANVTPHKIDPLDTATTCWPKEGVTRRELVTDLQHASPTGGFITATFARPPVLAEGHLVRHNGGWRLVEAAGPPREVTYVDLYDAHDDRSIRIVLMLGENMEVRTDTRVVAEPSAQES